ncbi:MAG: ExeM/NucH family extracellular endonuclease [Acidimicrobiia bacterium]
MRARAITRRPLAITAVLAMVAALLVTVGVRPAEAADDHLLLSEIVVTPTAGEFVEIHNPTGSAIGLTDYYLYDAFFDAASGYWNIVTGGFAGGGGFGDFHARFPAGSSIASGEYQTVSLNGATNYFATYGMNPTYELYETDPAVTDMLEAVTGSINGQGGLSSGEVVLLYTWDGLTDLVTDVDYALWGDKNEAISKTGISVDGPDADTDTSTYQPDTAGPSQDVIDTVAHPGGSSWQRIDLTEGTETGAGGNGQTGDDETSENWSTTWATLEATPGEDVPAGGIVINEIDYDQDAGDTAEFVELVNNSSSAIDMTGYELRLIDGSDASTYDTIALPAVELAAGDYFVVCANAATVPNCDLDDAPDTDFVQDGAPDAVALFRLAALIDTVSYEGDTAGFTEGSGVGLEDDLSVNRGISRFPDAGDTDMNNVDMSPRCITPGLPNDAGDTDCGDPIEVITTFGICGDPATPIDVIQGSGPTSPVAGGPGVGAVVEGVVVGDFESTTDGLSGFFLQEEDSEADGDPDTSDGIFVFNDGFGAGVAMGDVVRVKGNVVEFFGFTEINSVSELAVCGSDTASSATVTLPVATLDVWESVEGMSITIDQTLYASGNFTQARFGEVDLSVNGPLDNPTNVVAPGAAAIALQELNDRSRIQMDDGSTASTPASTPYIGDGGTLRTGDTLPGITGALGYSFGTYELHPTATVTFTRANFRPGVPNVGGNLEVAAYNVLNYFTTIDTGASICGPLGDQGCRGADTADEFTDQRDKIIDAIIALDAEVVGLMEIENAADNTPEADLVAGLNAVAGAGTYDYIATPGGVGDDAIRVAILYQPDAVTPVGDFAILDSSVDPAYNDDKNRAMLTQTFEENASGERITIAVNHLKSKGSDCVPEGDPDLGDGQGNCNVTRRRAAEAIVRFLDTDPTASGDSDFLILGDLNSYAKEDPITAITGAGYVDLIDMFQGSGFANGAYSFNFFSQSGYLDHGLSSPTMTPQVTGADFWHINADEPSGLDYNNFNPAALYQPDEFRSSDHDPVVIGLNLTTTPPMLAKPATVGVVDQDQGRWYLVDPILADLAGSNEVPSGDMNGSGRAQVTFNTNADQVCFSLDLFNVRGTVAAAHIHDGDAGVNGPVVVNLDWPKNGEAGCVSADSALIDSILADLDGFYVNVHSDFHPAGAVRGQLGGGPRAPFFFGNPSDEPFMGDWDGDGIATPGMYRPSDGKVYLRNSNTPGLAEIEYFFGDPDDVPLVGDWDGDGDDTVSLFRPSNSTVYIINKLGSGNAGIGAAEISFTFGNSTDQPFAGDFDGDGKDSVGVRSGEVFYWRNALSSFQATNSGLLFGDPGDEPMFGDWDGDGVDTPGVFRPSTSTIFLRNTSTPGPADMEIFTDGFESGDTSAWSTGR